MAWLDTGTHDSLLEAAHFIQTSRSARASRSAVPRRSPGAGLDRRCGSSRPWRREPLAKSGYGQLPLGLLGRSREGHDDGAPRRLAHRAEGVRRRARLLRRDLSRHERYLADAGIELPFVQDNHSRSRRGVLRGLHLQQLGRRESWSASRAARYSTSRPTSIRSRRNSAGGLGVNPLGRQQRQLWIPPGYAHGFLVLSEIADFEYKCTDYYDPKSRSGVIWNDPDLAIEWPIAEPDAVGQGSAVADTRRASSRQ